MSGRRFVVCDTETSGLTADARILSIAFVELWHDLNGESRAWYLNPGQFRMDPKAAQKNRITPEHLRGRPSFAQAHSELETWLQATDGQQYVLVGHRVDFDARRLAYEHLVLGLVMPPLMLLDTARLAEAAGVKTRPSLADLLSSLGMTNPAAHTAQGDAFVTAEAARVLLARYADQLDVEALPAGLDKLLVPFDPSSPDTNARRRADDEERTQPQLTSEHLDAHGADLRDGPSRRKVLDVCLTERCEQLATRMEDGIVSPAGARQVVEWALAHLEAGDLDRRMTGRVLAGLGRALRRCEKPSYAEQVLLTQLGPLLLQWGVCSSAVQCGRCLHSAGTCRFTEAGRQAVEAFIYDSSPYPQVRKAAAEAFLPGFDPTRKRSAGRPPEGLYQRLRRLGMLDAAGYGATRIAEYRRDQGSRNWGYSIASKAWNDGCRTPHLADLLASMTVLDGIGLDNRRNTDPKVHLRAALAVIDTCLAAHVGESGSILRRLERRRERLNVQLAASPRAQVEKPRNLRPARPSSPGMAPLQVGSQSKS